MDNNTRYTYSDSTNIILENAYIQVTIFLENRDLYFVRLFIIMQRYRY